MYSVEVPTEGLDCTPFSDGGNLLISLGFLLTTLLFLPLGRGNLQETIGVQMVAFGSMCVLLIVFCCELVSKGFPQEVPLYGESMSQLAGVVLFNYAFIITVPAWLSEKKVDVSVNKVIWGSSILATTIYIGFGTMGAMTFAAIGGNALVMLTSSKVHLVTRICGALFGVTTIGSGVPVFCVMIRTALFHTGSMSYDTSLFL
ncbi:hypothetical protein B484DRAFT_424555 [Ochromonadaceae sp. CCMP2298]|nr:hypothetical protein B484DRAFT_424555 [Ochromonadaceae sp. CCMP2298]